MKKISSLYIILLPLLSCNYAPQKQKNNLTYFDIKGYFDKEIHRLQKLQPKITKTVSVNDSAETRLTKIADWKKELALFSESDINRDSWRDLFKTERKNNVIRYTTQDENVPVKEIRIVMHNQLPREIKIVVNNINSLYDSTDSLVYYPDSLYFVKKSQKIRLLSEKKYEITGKF